MAGKRYKHPDTLQGHRQKPPMLSLVTPDKPDVPSAPRGLRTVAKAAWVSFWSSSISQVVDRDADMPALVNWAKNVSERERFRAILKTSPLVKGSTGQLVRNPLSGEIARLTAEINRAEEHFGMTPLSRMRLGIAVGEAHDILSDLTASLGSDEPEMVDLSEFDDVIDVSS
jgi:P27 family predicted phage terminase small subunit